MVVIQLKGGDTAEGIAAWRKEVKENVRRTG